MAKSLRWPAAVSSDEPANDGFVGLGRTMHSSNDGSDGVANGCISSFNGSANGAGVPREMVAVLIDRRVLIRDCFARCMRDVAPSIAVLPFATIEGWLTAEGDHFEADVVLLGVGERGQTGMEVEQSLRLLSQIAVPPPVVVVSDNEDTNQILEALDRGARGFIPTSVPLAVAIEAIRLVKAGGTFVPASSLMAARHAVEQPGSKAEAQGKGLFTEKQIAVVEALRQGKPNKIIAYELSMCEGTVKVHVRNIMRKLKASNRTQVAYLYKSVAPEPVYPSHIPALPSQICPLPVRA